MSERRPSSKRSASDTVSIIIRPSSPGGEQQRVAIARAIAPDPAILVADEPTGNLDEATGRQIVDLLFALKRDRGATLVLVTHDPGLARLCDRTVRLRSGRVDEAVAA